MKKNDRFSHHRLNVYTSAVALAGEARRINEGVPWGHRYFARQLLRSSGSIALLIAEGANRRTAAQQRQRYVEARGEAAEAAATVEVLEHLGFVTEEVSNVFQDRADRTSAMLTGLIRRRG